MSVSLSTISLIAAAAVEIAPVLKQYAEQFIGVSSVADFLRLMDELQEKEEMPTSEEIRARMEFPDPETILKRPEKKKRRRKKK